MGKSGPIATFNLIFLGLGWLWVGEFVGFIIILICFPTQDNLVYIANNTICNCHRIRCALVEDIEKVTVFRRFSVADRFRSPAVSSNSKKKGWGLYISVSREWYQSVSLVTMIPHWPARYYPIWLWNQYQTGDYISSHNGTNLGRNVKDVMSSYLYLDAFYFSARSGTYGSSFCTAAAVANHPPRTVLIVHLSTWVGVRLRPFDGDESHNIETHQIDSQFMI